LSDGGIDSRRRFRVVLALAQTPGRIYHLGTLHPALTLAGPPVDLGPKARKAT
jgi:hypothetical protein